MSCVEDGAADAVAEYEKLRADKVSHGRGDDSGRLEDIFDLRLSGKSGRSGGEELIPADPCHRARAKHKGS